MLEGIHFLKIVSHLASSRWCFGPCGIRGSQFELFAASSADQVYVGPGQLYQDLQNLLHDLNVIGQISQLIGNLKGNYQVTVRATGRRILFPRLDRRQCEAMPPASTETEN